MSGAMALLLGGQTAPVDNPVTVRETQIAAAI
jgi:hypothetical protein